MVDTRYEVSQFLKGDDKNKNLNLNLWLTDIDPPKSNLNHLELWYVKAGIPEVSREVTMNTAKLTLSGT